MPGPFIVGHALPDYAINSSIPPGSTLPSADSFAAAEALAADSTTPRRAFINPTGKKSFAVPTKWRAFVVKAREPR